MTGLVVLECGVLALNGGRCPLSDLAAKFTADRTYNFDIYLPNLLAKHNKTIFGLLFLAGELAVFGCWFSEKYAVSFGTNEIEERSRLKVRDRLSREYEDFVSSGPHRNVGAEGRRALFRACFRNRVHTRPRPDIVDRSATWPEDGRAS